jgi:hypothetical protein
MPDISAFIEGAHFTDLDWQAAVLHLLSARVTTRCGPAYVAADRFDRDFPEGAVLLVLACPERRDHLHHGGPDVHEPLLRKV